MEKEAEFQQAIGKMVSDFENQRKEYIRFIDDEQKFIPKFFPNYVELLDHIDIIKIELMNKEQQKEQFTQWQRDGEIIEVEFKEIE